MRQEDIVAEARSWICTPYHHGAAVKGAGCDCLGLIRGVWRALYGAEPEPAPRYGPVWLSGETGERMAEAARRHFEEVAPDAFGAGDLLLFRWKLDQPARHAAIAAGGGRMVHAQEGACVSEVAMGSWWRRRLAYAFRFPGKEQ